MMMVVNSCKIDDFSEEVATGDANPAPTISLISPTDTLRVSLARDQPVIIQADIFDETPALSIFGVSLTDTTGRAVFSEEIPIQGTSRLASVQFGDSLLQIGQRYTLVAYTEDSEGKRAEVTEEYISVGLLSNQAEMYILGNFNGWGGTDNQMTLIADNTWRETAQVSAGDEFKFVNTPNFSDTDWGDAECDNQAEERGANINCFTEDGTYEFLFNDANFSYSIRKFNQVAPEVFLLGEYNGWGNSEDAFELVEDNTWELAVNFTGPVKFVEGSNFGVTDYGDNECDGIADPFGANIECGDGDVTITFNDATLVYTIETNE
jgi:hypothetical protein